MLSKHLGKQARCNSAYSEDEITAAKNLKKSLRSKSYNKKNQEKIADKQASYNRRNRESIKQKQGMYNMKNRETIAKKQKIYRKKKPGDIAQKKRVYESKNKEQIAPKQKQYRKNRKSLSPYGRATQDLLEDRPKYHIYSSLGYPMVVKWIDTEQLVDCLTFFKEHCGLDEYQSISIDI